MAVATSSQLAPHRKLCCQLCRSELHRRRSVWTIQCLELIPPVVMSLYPAPSCSLDFRQEVLLPYGDDSHFKSLADIDPGTSGRSSFIVTIVFMVITAMVLAEICSALPLSGSIYVWAAESAGPKHARFFGFLVAWWACTAWMTFTASTCQASLESVRR